MCRICNLAAFVQNDLGQLPRSDGRGTGKKGALKKMRVLAKMRVLGAGEDAGKGALIWKKDWRCPEYG